MTVMQDNVSVYNNEWNGVIEIVNFNDFIDNNDTSTINDAKKNQQTCLKGRKEHAVIIEMHRNGIPELRIYTKTTTCLDLRVSRVSPWICLPG